MSIFSRSKKPSTDAPADFRAAITKAISVAKLSGMPIAAISQYLGDVVIGLERDQFSARAHRQYNLGGTEAVNEASAQAEKARLIKSGEWRP